MLRVWQLTTELAAQVEVQMVSGTLTIQLSTKRQSITFKVLPAFNALGECSWGCGAFRSGEACGESKAKGVADSYVGPLR